MKRKKAIIAIVCLLLAGLVIFFFYRYSLQNASKADEFDDASIDVSEYADFLEQAGVPKENIDSLEHSIIKYIAEDLKSKEGTSEWSFLREGEDFTSIFVDNGEFSYEIYAFKCDDEIYAYTVFDITNIKKTAVNTIALAYGKSFMPYDYGGMLWERSGNDGNKLREVNPLIANFLTLSSGSISGEQLKLKRGKLYVGCIFTHIECGKDADNRIFVYHSWE